MQFVTIALAAELGGIGSTIGKTMSGLIPRLRLVTQQESRAACSAAASLPQARIEMRELQMDIRIVQSKAEREAIYAFRYSVYVAEMGIKQEYADHKAKMIEEPCDASSLIVAAYDDGRLIGTARMQLGTQAMFGDYIDLFNMKAFGSFFPDKASLTTKLMVDPAYRGSSVAVRLAKRLFAEALNRGISFDFICCYSDTRDFFVRLGYRQLFPDIHHPEYGAAHPMVLAMRDRAFLESIRSPFAPLVQAEHVDAASVDLFQQLLTRGHDAARK